MDPLTASLLAGGAGLGFLGGLLEEKPEQYGPLGPLIKDNPELLLALARGYGKMGSFKLPQPALTDSPKMPDYSQALAMARIPGGTRRV